MAIIVVGVSGGLLAVAAIPEQNAVAGVTEKFHYTNTMDSVQSHAQGHETHQIVPIHEASPGVIYEGKVTYVSSTPVQVSVLHEIDPADSRGQAIWIIDEDTMYGWTFIDDGTSAGTVEYVGAGLMLHTRGDAFVATYTVDGWMRAHATDMTQ